MFHLVAFQENGWGATEAFDFVKSKRSHVMLWANQRCRVKEFKRLVDEQNGQ